ncbi:MAG: DUF4276 family protein [Chloroflexi bacterium]|nr:DUF4276 family protein [Chloroflexota bacterium]
MYIECLVEEPSAKAALDILIPQIVGPDIECNIRSFEGKPDLLNKLPILLRGYSYWHDDNLRIAVLVDRDDDDCHHLKARLEEMAQAAGFLTKSMASQGAQFQVLNRLAIEELEAWFFGDVAAIRAVYPRVSANLENQERYRDPDAIPGGTWEALERLLKRHRYIRGGLPKTKVAGEIAPHMDPALNRSGSFKVFCQGLVALVS